MNDFNQNRPTDPELEEALAFAASLKSTHEEEPSDPPAPPAKAEPAAAEPAARPKKAADKPAAKKAKKATDAPAEEDDAPKKGNRFLNVLYRIIPVTGDPWWEVGRKLLFLVALVVLVGSLAMLLNEAVIIPKENAELHQELTDIFNNPRDSQQTGGVDGFTDYPAGVTSVGLKNLYALNSDVRAWLTYKSCGVDEWVMYSADQDYYLTHDFYRNSNKNGSLFFDSANNLATADAHYKSLVIYGHNMASGQMFAGLNALTSSVDTMKRAGSIVQLETLFEKAQYKIFAVVLQDSKSKIEHYYSIQATSFTSDMEFMSYVEGLRARSLYDFNGVDVVASDDILIMYTCSPKSAAGFDDARLGVIARKVRPGESATVDSSTITVNKDVIMPYAWYTAQKKTPHEFYETGVLPSSGTITTTKPSDTTGTNNGDDTTTTDGNSDPTDNTTTPSQGGTVPTSPPTTPGTTTPPSTDGTTTGSDTTDDTTTNGDTTTGDTTTDNGETGDTTTEGNETTTAGGDETGATTTGGETGDTTTETPTATDAMTDTVTDPTAAQPTSADTPADTPAA